MKVLGQDRHLACGLIHCDAVKEETIAINHDCVYNQANETLSRGTVAVGWDVKHKHIHVHTRTGKLTLMFR